MTVSPPARPVGPAAKRWYKRVADAWGGRWLEAQAEVEFSSLGYYSTAMPSRPRRGAATELAAAAKVRLVVMNTELFNHGNDVVVAGETIEAALAHLVWLNSTLAAVKAAGGGQRAYIIGHV